MERSEEISDKYIDDNGDPDADKVWVTNSNRNMEKPDIDKPPYDSSK